MNNAESYKLRFDMKEIKFLGWVGILLFGLFFAACSDDAADKEWDGGTGSLLVAPEVVVMLVPDRQLMKRIKSRICVHACSKGEY